SPTPARPTHRGLQGGRRSWPTRSEQQVSRSEPKASEAQRVGRAKAGDSREVAMGAPAVLVLDDGELDDVQEMLQEMAIPFARVRGGAIVAGSEPPRDLLIATPRRIDAVRDAVGEAIDGPVRMMVVNEDSNALRSQLRRSGFDYLVRRPVHAEALRLMLLHCCYKGEERRRELRVAVGIEVSFRVGLGENSATLVDLSSRGCRLLTQRGLGGGKGIIVQIPEGVCPAEA